MDYKKTLNLPHTLFPMRANLAQREKEAIEKHSKEKLYHMILEKNQDHQNYILHDGPPYANGDIHVGHAVNKVLKDITIKYHMLHGFHTPYTLGWDCHGLPIELQVMQKLDNDKKSRVDIVRQKCREHAQQFINKQKTSFQRLNIFADFDKNYQTMDYQYEADTFQVLTQIYNKGYLYRGLRPVHWCPSCRTALADAEIEYQNHQSTSLYLGFPIQDNLWALVWTTTPWTLPANVALAFHQDIRYSIFQLQDSPNQYIMAYDLKESIEKYTGRVLSYVKDISIQDILKLEIQHPFLERKSKTITADYVTLEMGTGIVHTAPGHGLDDFSVAAQHQLPVIMPVDEKGCYTKEFSLMEGKNITEAQQSIIELLEKSNNLFFYDLFEHSYPHCWRCKNPVITRTTEQWFINMNHQNLLSRIKTYVNEEIQVFPQEKKGRLLATLENRPDWCISRQRVWGVPIGALKCLGCQKVFIHQDIHDSIHERAKVEGFDFWFREELSVKDLFPHFKNCPECHTEQDFIKTYDILDVWFDSAVSWYHTFKYPDQATPVADLYLEGSDQFRAWFQVSLIIRMILDEKSPYQNILSHGFVLDEHGKAMSKSLGNVIQPADIIQKYGADVLRLWIVSQDYTQDMRVGDNLVNQIADAYRKIRNTFRFLLSNLYDYNQEIDNSLSLEDLTDIDKWLIYRLEVLNEELQEEYRQYRFYNVFKKIYHFMNLELSSFYLDILKDVLYTFKKDSIKRRSSQKAMYQVLEVLTKLLAPILSFTCDEVYSFFPFKKEEEENCHSVFLSGFSNSRSDLVQKFQNQYDLLETVQKVRDSVLKVLEQIRVEKVIGSNLEVQVTLVVKDDSLFSILETAKEDLATYFIVSKVNLLREVDNTDLILAHKVSESIPELSILVKKAEGEKCPRCWKYSTLINENQVVCSSCEEALIPYKDKE